MIYFNANNSRQLYKFAIQKSFDEFCDLLAQSVLNRTPRLMDLTITEVGASLSIEYESGKFNLSKISECLVKQNNFILKSHDSQLLSLAIY